MLKKKKKNTEKASLFASSQTPEINRVRQVQKERLYHDVFYSGYYLSNRFLFSRFLSILRLSLHSGKY